MAEEKYTWDDIIIDPTSERAKEAVGKLVYYADVPLNCINYANVGLIKFLGVLDETNQKCYPFHIKGGNQWACIIVKKEEPKTKYVPFENAREFINVYSCVEATSLKKEDYFLSSHGIWLKRKDKPPILMVTEIYSFGVVISGDMNTTKKPNDEYVTITETTLWRELLRGYTFLDGSPCGKSMEE